ncbi:MAG: Rne/Rng family ribonuclease [Candidatus Omnitrophica bacterium]|nr:Rne/Rng family ribonuclease [Candidatus Omnitrophota bacterium]
MKQILINVEPYEKRVAVTLRGTLEEFHIERADQARLAGNVYKGVIESVVPGIGALFVNIGTGKNGFLYIDDLEGSRSQPLLEEEVAVNKKGKIPGFFARKNPPPKQSVSPGRPKKGQEVIVQVVKEPIGTKGPLLTTDISLPGKYIVFMPFNDTVGVSKRVEDRQKRARLKEVLEKLDLPKGMGCIARTQSIEANPRQIRLEFKYLLSLWSRIQQRAEKQRAPLAVYEEYGLPLRIIRDYFDEDIEKILVDSREEYKKIARFAGSIQSNLRKKIFYYRGKTPLYEKYGIEERIEKIFHRKIFLKSGGSIVIEQTEGLVAIDVNTGKFTGKRNPEETVFKTNMEATQEVARQVMLRDIGGIIVIDFIDMADRGHRKEVTRALESAFKRDKAKINISPISSIGLVEMTRQRIRKSLESVSFRECPYCNGMGRVKTPATIAIAAIRKLRRKLAEKSPREVFIIAHPDVADHLEAVFKNTLRFLERRFRKRITIKRDSKIHVEDIYFE